MNACRPKWKPFLFFRSQRCRCTTIDDLEGTLPLDPSGMSLAADRRRKAKALEEAGAALSVKLHARSTRGQRISELQGEDAEADETFWGQGAWQEEEDGDSEFSSEEGSLCAPAVRTELVSLNA